MRLEDIGFYTPPGIKGAQRSLVPLPCGLHADMWLDTKQDTITIYIEKRDVDGYVVFGHSYREYKTWYGLDPLTAQSILFWLFTPEVTKEMLHGSDA